MTSPASIRPNLAINADDLHPTVRDLQKSLTSCIMWCSRRVPRAVTPV
jgi:hypothetical protein